MRLARGGFLIQQASRQLVIACIKLKSFEPLWIVQMLRSLSYQYHEENSSCGIFCTSFSSLLFMTDIRHLETFQKLSYSSTDEIRYMMLQRGQWTSCCSCQASTVQIYLRMRDVSLMLSAHSQPMYRSTTGTLHTTNSSA